MSVLFSESGQDNDLAVSSPNLSGDFIPAIDMPTFTDGFGLVTPWGGGATKRNYSPYGVSAENTAQGTQLNDLSGLMGLGGGDLSYNIEGLVGPQGVPGPKGDPGVSGFVMWGQYPGNPSYLTDLPNNINQINDLGTAADKMLYTASYTTVYPWIQLDISSAEDGWNDADVDEAVSLVVIAADSGIFLSANDGNNWSSVTPGDESTYSNVRCDSTGDVIVALGDDSKLSGLIWVSIDGGTSWEQKEVIV